MEGLNNVPCSPRRLKAGLANSRPTKVSSLPRALPLRGGGYLVQVAEYVPPDIPCIS